MVLSDLFMRMRNGCFQFKKEKKILYVKSLFVVLWTPWREYQSPCRGWNNEWIHQGTGFLLLWHASGDHPHTCQPFLCGVPSLKPCPVSASKDPSSQSPSLMEFSYSQAEVWCDRGPPTFWAKALTTVGKGGNATVKISNGNCEEVEGTQQGSWPAATAQSLQNHRSPCTLKTNEKGNCCMLVCRTIQRK